MMMVEAIKMLMQLRKNTLLLWILRVVMAPIVLELYVGGLLLNLYQENQILNKLPGGLKWK